MKNIVLSDQLLANAAAEYMDAYISTLPTPEELPDHEFSAEYITKREKLIRRVEMRESLRRCARSVAAVFLALILGSGLFLGVNSEARADFLRWARSMYENSIIYRFVGESAESPLPNCELTWVPKGYELVRNERDENSLVMIYKNESGDGIVFSCDRVTENSLMQIGITKEFTSEKVYVKGCDAELFRFDGGNVSVIWFDNKNGFIYAVDGTVSEPVILHIAEGVKLANSTN